jgi:hypothetical protein
MTGKITKIALVAMAGILTLVDIFAQRVFFPPCCMPPASFLPVFIFFSIWDALAFGVGIAILVYLGMSYSKWPKEIRSSLLVVSFIAVWFTALNWVHDGLHNTGAMPPNWALLAFTESLFHVPWLLFGIALVFATRQLVNAYKK